MYDNCEQIEPPHTHTHPIKDIEMDTFTGTHPVQPRCDLTIEAQVLKVAVAEVVLHDGHEGGHLAEEQHAVVGVLQLGEDPVEELKLARSSVQIVSTRQEQTSPSHPL